MAHEATATRRRTFAVATLGCKVNQADSEAISEQFIAAGYEPCDFAQPADIYIVNTCTVTHLGDRSSRQLISQARRRNPDALLVVTGCYAEVNPQAVAALPGVDLVVGNRDKDHLLEYIAASEHGDPNTTPPLARTAACSPRPGKSSLQRWVLPVLSNPTAIGRDPEPQPDGEPFLIHSRTRVQMKVQDGCDNRCTYCIVPYARGASRSRSIASVVDHVRRKVALGFKEVVLTGVHLGDYHDGDADLGDLIRAILEQTDIQRLRVSSLEPEDFQPHWLDLWADPRMCRHLHLPLQSGCDAILRRMGRRYTTDRYRTIIETARTRVPGIAITTDVIVGFPGETNDHFTTSLRFVEACHFAKIHVFRFSPRQGTAAARMRDQVPERIKKERSTVLLALSDEHGRQFRRTFLGQTMDVLWEEEKESGWEGLTDNYIRVTLISLPGDHQSPERSLRNRITPVVLRELTDDGALGEPTSTASE
jgi:threonylcarbamoyladenosine tRNA methylthiotransferase MtaB